MSGAMMLNSLGPCGCGASCSGCEVFIPPADPLEPIIWDTLAVQFTQTKLVLRRCSLVSTPLLSAAGGLASGATPAYFQPDGVGPPLSEVGGYAIDGDRRASLVLGQNIENTPEVDLSPTEANFGGSRKLEGQTVPGGFGVSRHSPGSGDSCDWSRQDSIPVSVRMTRPIASDGARYVWCEIGNETNGEARFAHGHKWIRYNLQDGTSDTYMMTEDAAVITFADVEERESAQRGAGQSIAIGDTKRLLVTSVNRITHQVKTLEHTFDDQSAWLTAAAVSVRDRTYDYTEGITPVAWQWDNNEQFLEVERVPSLGLSRIYTNGPEGRVLLIQDAPLDGIPFCYQRRGGRHVFLVDDSQSPFFSGTLLGSILYDVDEAAGGAVSSGNDCGTPNRQDLSASAHFVNVGARGQLLLVTTGGAQSIGTSPELNWSLANEGPRSVHGRGASIAQETWHGAVHVRGVFRDGGVERFRFDEATPAARKDVATTTPYSSVLAVHPEGPAGGVTIARQFTADQTDYPSNQGGGPFDGTEVVHFAGEEWLGRYQTAEDRRFNSPEEWFDTSLGSLAYYPHGLLPAPLPANYAPGASGY